MIGMNKMLGIFKNDPSIPESTNYIKVYIQPQ